MKSLSPLAVAFVLVLLGQPAVAIEKTRLTLARAKTAQGEKLLTQSEYAGAERKFRKALAVEPALPTAHLGLGAALVGQKRFDEALAVLEETEKKYVEWEQTIQIADLVKRQLAERQMLTIADLAAATSSFSVGVPVSAAESTNAAGMNRIRTEQFVFRERWALEGVHAIPSQVFYLEGISYLRTNQRKLGIEALEVCLLINRKHFLAHYNLAVALFTTGEVAEAKSHFDVAVAHGVEPHGKFAADLERASERIVRQ